MKTFHFYYIICSIPLLFLCILTLFYFQMIVSESASFEKEQLSLSIEETK